MIRNIDLIQRLKSRNKKAAGVERGQYIFKYFGLDKASAENYIKITLVVLSLASAHYSGFMSQVPFEMISITAVDFLPAFISVFVFYFVLSYSIARVFAFGLSQFYMSVFYSMLVLPLWLRKKWPEKFRKSGVKTYKEITKLDPFIYWLILGCILVYVFNFSYLKFDYFKIGGHVKFLAISVFVALIFKAGFTIRNPLVVFKRMVNKRRVAYRRSLLKAFIYFLTGFSLGLSFYAGVLRYDKVVAEDAVNLKIGEYSRFVNLLVSSGGAFLAVDKSQELEVYIYAKDNVLVTLTEKPKEPEGEK